MAKLPEKFTKAYDPTEAEEPIYKRWIESGYFNPDNLPGERENAFTIMLPPPNVTDKLHMGHVTIVAFEDTMVRYHRMKGDKALWLPGTDHAAIATQTKVEKEIQKKEKKNRHDLGRAEFLNRVHDFAKESQDTIIHQIEKLGASVDWSRQAFTLDETRHRAVNTAFKKMYDDGLIYRGFRIVNWDPKGQTTVSDDEVEHEPTTSTLYTFKYDADFPIAIATTRPETKLGDTAVAVHPDDERYREYIGKTYKVDFLGVPLKISVIADEGIDPEYGTGALGVTPAHSATDWDLAQKHNLPSKQVINEYAKIDGVSDEFDGLKTKEASGRIVEGLRDAGLLEGEENIEINLSKAQRSGGTIEPLPKLQWFVDVSKEFTLKNSKIEGVQSGEKTNLRALMRHVVDSGQIEIIPENFKKIYFHWTENLRDWCISRQIWYGHRIPVWYKDDEVFCDTEAPEGEGWQQDPDTLDTWFSSGLWTFSTLGWPEETQDLETFHPTNVLETGYDILFFWVARMILMSGYFMEEVPFETVYLHGMVKDQKGKKMSKTLGNVINPLDMIEKYGADATRLSLIIGNPPGSDPKLSEDKIRAYKKFSNKIWNAARFVLENLDEAFDPDKKPELTEADQKHMDELTRIGDEVTHDIENYRFDLAGEKLYHFFWHTFADVVIEEAKTRLESDDASERAAAQYTLYEILASSMRLLHPFAPFVTEEVWQHLPKKKNDLELLIASSWPN